MKVYQIVSFGKYRRPVKAVTVATEENEGKKEALDKAKAKGAFTQGVNGFTVTKISNVDFPELTLEFCAREIVKNGGMRVGKSLLSWCYDGTVSVTDWNGQTKWFPQLSIEAVRHFIDIQPV